jgi:hypothetical protein
MRHRRSSARLAALAALALALAGCAGAAAGPTVPAAPSSASAAGTRAPASLAGALHQAGQCIRQHGIPGFADPTVDSAGQLMMDKAQLGAVPNAVAKQAVLACRDALGLAGIQSGNGGIGGKPTPQELREILAFARILIGLATTAGSAVASKLPAAVPALASLSRRGRAPRRSSASSPASIPRSGRPGSRPPTPLGQREVSLAPGVQSAVRRPHGSRSRPRRICGARAG